MLRAQVCPRVSILRDLEGRGDEAQQEGKLRSALLLDPDQDRDAGQVGDASACLTILKHDS